jgi:hypothetical protein
MHKNRRTNKAMPQPTEASGGAFSQKKKKLLISKQTAEEEKTNTTLGQKQTTLRIGTQVPLMDTMISIYILVDKLRNLDKGALNLIEHYFGKYFVVANLS